MLPWAEVGEAIAIESAGALVQGSIGFGINLIAAPLLVSVDPRFAPAPLVLAGLVSGVLVASRERGFAEWTRVKWAIAGRLPGTVVGAVVVAAVPGSGVRISIAASVLVAVGLSLVGWRLPMNVPSLLGTGAASGVMGTVAGLGGTPMGLLYQDAPGPVMRATLTRYTVLGGVLSLAALALAGKAGPAQLVLAAILLPGVVVGFVISGTLRRFVDRRWLRPLALGIAAASSLLVLIRGF